MCYLTCSLRFINYSQLPYCEQVYVSGIVEDLGDVDEDGIGLLKFLKKKLGHCGFHVLSSEVSEHIKFILSAHLIYSYIFLLLFVAEFSERGWRFLCMDQGSTEKL